MNLNGVDLNLLPPLGALLRLRSVTAAARDTGMSQPAMSRAWARLRGLLGDPLLVRTPAGYVLTPHGERLRPEVEAMLEATRAILQPHAFDPAIVVRTIRFAGTDTHTTLLMPPLVERLGESAPGLSVRVTGYSANLAERLLLGELDFAFALASTPLPPGARSVALGSDELVVVMRRDHPAAARAWTAQDYARWPSVGIAIVGDGQSELDAHLAALQIERRLVLVTQHFIAALTAVAATDMVTTVSRAFASRFADGLGLVLKPTPLPGASFGLTLVSAAVRASDPLLRWIEEEVKAITEACLTLVR